MWYEFISLSERKQIELLSGLTHQSAFNYDDNDDVDMGDDMDTHPPPRGYNNSNNYGGRHRHGKRNSRRHRHRPVIRLEAITEDPNETTADAFGKSVLLVSSRRNGLIIRILG